MDQAGRGCHSVGVGAGAGAGAGWRHMGWCCSLFAVSRLTVRLLLHIIEAGIDLALLSDNTHQGETWDGDDDGNEIEKRVAQLLNDDEINTEYKKAFRQQMIIGWEYIFTGIYARGWRKCWTERHQWATKFSILMMTWGRA